MNMFKGFWQKQGTSGYITNKQKFQLAFPQMPLAISNGLIHSAYIKVYTDILGLDIKYVGIIWMLFSIWNAINDPLMGVFMDRFRYTPRRGKYTYILKVTAPVTVLSSAAMLYAQPDWPTWVIFGFLTVLLFIYDTTQTGYAIAYSN
jgi:GPH family glycoside/pentoside/hexuronide:cation symporter